VGRVRKKVKSEREVRTCAHVTLAGQLKDLTGLGVRCYGVGIERVGVGVRGKGYGKEPYSPNPQPNPQSNADPPTLTLDVNGQTRYQVFHF
jgi:hypothetical protein